MSTIRRSTDSGTVYLHAALVVSFVVLVATGLRIATDDPDSEWLRILDPVLPVEHLWFRHMVAGVALMAILAAYACLCTWCPPAIAGPARQGASTGDDAVRQATMGGGRMWQCSGS